MLDQTRKLRESDDLAIGDVGNMRLPEEFERSAPTVLQIGAPETSRMAKDLYRCLWLQVNAE